MEKAGVRIVLRKGSGAIFYIGKRLGIYVLKADSRREVAAQVQYQEDVIKSNNETLVGIETDTPDDRTAGKRYITKIFTYK